MYQLCKRALGLLVLAMTIFTTARADAGDVGTYKDTNGIEWRYTVLSDTECALGDTFYSNLKTASEKIYSALVDVATSGEVVAPTEINGMKVTTLRAGAFSYCSNITKVTLPEKIKLEANASGIFYYCQKLTSVDVSDWVTDEAENMYYLFSQCIVLEDPVDVSKWNVSKVTNFSSMFNSCKKITKLDVSKWNTESATNMAGTFTNCESLKDTLDVSNWKTENVTTFLQTFFGCKTITVLDVSKWDTKSAKSLQGTFYGCQKVLKLDVSNWNTANVTTMASTFRNCYALKDTLDVSNWNTGKVTTLESTFDGCKTLTMLDVSKWNTEKVTTLKNTFYNCSALKDTLDVSNWNTAEVKTLYQTFYKCEMLTYLDVSNWNTEKVANMQSTFSTCRKLVTLDVSGWNTAGVTTMYQMFMYTNKLNPIDISDWNVSKVANFNYFLNGSAGADTLDISKWQFGSNFTETKDFTKSPTYMMFAPVKRIKLPATTLPIHITGMFCDAQALELTLPSDITTLGAKCFVGAKQLKQITIPAKVASIGKEAFSGTTALTEVFMMPATPPTLTDTIGLEKATIYVKSSALETYKTADVWSKIADRITDQIPLTLASGRTYATVGRDFDCDFTNSKLTPYKATQYEKTDDGTQNVTIEQLTDYYVPSRTGDDNFTFHGVLLKAEQSGTYYYKMGESDYASESPNTSLADAETNYFVPSYETWYLDPTWQNDPKNWLYYPKENSYNYALSNNVFKGIRSAGNTSRNKAFLALPRGLFGDDKYSESNRMMIMIADDEDETITGINLVERSAAGDDSQYNLAGQRVGKAYKGIVIKNGKKYYHQ